MRTKTSNDSGTGSDTEDTGRGQTHSRRASLIRELSLDAEDNEFTHPEAAEEFVLQTLIPCDFAKKKA